LILKRRLAIFRINNERNQMVMNYNNDVVIDMNGIWISVYSKTTFFVIPAKAGIQ